MGHLISPLDFTVEETYEVLDFADRIAANPKAYAHAADGRQLATLFYEPSTRTRLSFESAMLSLGGQTIGFAGADQSSVSKGETIADTVRVVSCYADIIVMRHPKEGAPLCASMYSKIPVINAGDGGHNHPTQTLIDLMTIRQRLGRLDNLTIGYTFDLSQRNKVIRSIRVFCTGMNLLTISGYSGLDPEVAIVGLTSGVDPINKYPNLRSYIVGASFNF